MSNDKLDTATMQRCAKVFNNAADHLTDFVSDEVVANALFGAWLEWASARYGMPSVYDKLVHLKADVAATLEIHGYVVPSDEEILQSE